MYEVGVGLGSSQAELSDGIPVLTPHRIARLAITYTTWACIHAYLCVGIMNHGSIVGYLVPPDAFVAGGEADNSQAGTRTARR